VRTKILLAGCALLCACDMTFENTTPRVAKIEKVERRLETKVLLTDDCVAFPQKRAVATPETLAPLLLAGLGALVPLVSDFVVGGIEKYLQARKDALTAHHVGITGGQLYGNDGRLNAGCLIVARGEFGRHNETSDPMRGSLDLGKIRSAPLELADYPDFYFEAKWSLDAGGDGTSATITIDPLLVHFSRTKAGRTASGSKTINLLLLMATTPINVKQQPADKDKDKEKAIAVIPIQFEKVKIGTEIGPQLLKGRQIKVPVPPFGDAAKRQAAANTRALVAANDGNLKGVQPFNLAAYVEEAETPTAFDELLLSTFTKNKDNVATALKAILKDLLGIEDKK